MSDRLGGAGVRVVLAGTGRHVAGSRLPPVPAVAETLRSLRETLVTACGVRAEAVTTVLDPPGPEPLLDAVIEAAETATDVLIVYYVGHGVRSPDGALHLATRATADLTRKAAYQALPYAELRTVLADCRARLVVVVLDCCFSGRADVPVPSGALLASADRDELALAVPGEPYTAFSGSLIAALRDGIPTAPAELRLHHVFDHVHREMRQNGRPAPVLRIGNAAGELVLARNRAYRAVTAEAADPGEGVSPYRGLEPYTVEDEAVYAGRSALVENVLRRLRTGGPVLVTGPSGCGKTSLIAAGVIPAVRAGGIGLSRQIVVTPPALPDDLTADDLLVVDQFEELFTADLSEEDRRSFVAAVAASPATVLLALRSDFDDRCARYPELAAALEERNVVVGPMTDAELRTAIVEPAERTGFTLEPGLVELLLRDAGADSLPLLSHALLRTWQQRSGHTLTVDGYLAVGGVSGAVAASAERVFDGLGAARQEAARRLLLRMVRISDDGPDTRRRLDRSTVTDPSAAAVLEAFAEARLITLDRDTAVLTHEALIRSWPRLSGWINADRAGQQAAQELAEDAAAWRRGGSDTAMLYRGGRLAAVRRISTADADSRAFLDASLRHERRQSRLRRATIAALLVLTVAASTAAVLAFNRNDRLNRQLATATAENLAGVSDLHAVDRPALSTRLALAAYRSDPASAAARNVLGDRYLAMRSVERVFPDLTEQPIAMLLSSRDGRTVALVQDDGITVVTGLMDDAPQTWPVPGARGRDPAALSRDGRWLASLDSEGAAALWDLQQRTGPLRLPDSPAGMGIPQLRFSPDGGRVLLLTPANDPGDRLFLWRTDTRAELTVPKALVAGITAAWFTDAPDRLLVEAGSHSTRSLTDGRVLTRFPPNSQVAGEGRWLVPCPGDASSRPDTYLATATGKVAARLATASHCASGGVISDGEHTLISTALDEPYAPARITSIGTGDAWDFVVPWVRRTSGPSSLHPPWLAIPAPPADTPPKALFAVGNAVFRLTPTARNLVAEQPGTTLSEDGRYFLMRDPLARDGADVVEVYDRTSGQRLARRAIEEQGLIDGTGDYFSDPIMVSPQGTRFKLTSYPLPQLTPLAAADLPAGSPVPDTNLIGRSLDARRLALIQWGTLSVWDLPTGRMVAGPIDLGGSDEFKRGLHLRVRPRHPDEVVVWAAGEPIQLWNLAEKRLVATIRAEPALGVGDAVAFDPAGDRLAVIADGRRVEMWNVEDGTRRGSPFAVPNAQNLLGFTDDGYLVAGIGAGLELWDLERRSLSGDLRFDNDEPVADVITDADPLRLNGDGVMPAEIPLTAAVWAERLCAAFAGPFSDAERALLPAGADLDDPCADVTSTRR